ncbi:hypothetical protein REPUB_Repub18cG0045600 [Reevesia pubescens]
MFGPVLHHLRWTCGVMQLNLSSTCFVNVWKHGKCGHIFVTSGDSHGVAAWFSARWPNSIGTRFDLIELSSGVNVNSKSKQTVEAIWSPPLAGSMKFNVDGFSLGNPRPAVSWVNNPTVAPWRVKKHTNVVEVAKLEVLSWKILNILREDHDRAYSLAKEGVGGIDPLTVMYC